MNNKIHIKKNVHKIYQELIDSKRKYPTFKMKTLVGKWQYIYSSEKGEISLVLLKNYLKEGGDFWEIYSLNNNLFDDVERFKTKRQAEKRIRDLLQ